MVDTSIMTLSGAVLMKAGTNANATAKGITYIDEFVSEAESFVNSATMKNWSDAYATLNSDVKKVLSEAVTNLAAIYIINYDMSGYTSRSEAELMIKVLYRRAKDCIEILKQQPVETFVAAA